MLLPFLILALLAAWIVLYWIVIRPKLMAFRYTAGIYVRIQAAEASAWSRIVLWLKGLKVMIAGVVTSALPIVPVLYDKLSGTDWTQFFPSERAKVIGLIVFFAGVAGPMIMVVLHNAGLAEAAKIEPTKE